MPIVSITDYTFPNLDIEESLIRAAGAELHSSNDKQVDAFKSLVADADAVITIIAPTNAEVIAAMLQARVIVRYGIGVDDVDLSAARARGIPVCNVPDDCIDEVADPTLAFILGITRQVVPNAIHDRDVIVASHIASASPKAVRTLQETAACITVMALRGEVLAKVVN